MTTDTLAPVDIIIRQREDADLPALGALLERDQPTTRYPFVWPFPGGSDAFLRRSTEVQSWTAEVDGRPVGHASVTTASDDPISRAWAAAHHADISELRCISALFADLTLAGHGVGSRLLAAATEYAEADGYPVLDVVAAHETPVKLYLKRGWQIIGTTQAPWHPELDLDLPIHLMILPRLTQE
nr:GNAT family N-acetyltransferase [Flexivirga meconopsidis]